MNTKVVILSLGVMIVMAICMMVDSIVEAAPSPISSLVGQLDSSSSSSSGKSSLLARGHQSAINLRVRRLKEPMPWEDGFFRAEYHAWPKNRDKSSEDKATSAAA